MEREKNEITPLGVGLVVLTILGIGGVSVWGWMGRDDESTLDRIRRTGVVRIGYANEAPYGYLDSETNQITGEAPEIAKVILERLGAEKIESVVTEFGSLIPALKARRFDLIAAGMYIRPDRAQQIDFSRPTYEIGEAFLVKKGNPLNLHSFEDVAKHESARLGVMGGSVEHGYAKELGVPEERIVVLPDYPSALAGLQTGRMDAVAATVLTANRLLRKGDDEGIQKAKPFRDPVIDGKTVKGYGAFGFRKGDDEFRRAFDRELEKFLGTEQHLELVRPFGFSEDTTPEDLTAADVIERLK